MVSIAWAGSHRRRNTLNRSIRLGLALLLASTAAMFAILPRSADAQCDPIACFTGPFIVPPQSPLPGTLNYADSGGPGTATLTAQGPSDPSGAGGEPVRISITQNGATYQGRCEIWVLPTPASQAQGTRDAGLACWILDTNGGVIFLDGEVTFGNGAVHGQGEWLYPQNPNMMDHWTMSN